MSDEHDPRCGCGMCHQKRMQREQGSAGPKQQPPPAVACSDWIAGEPHEAGYYLATTVTERGHRGVSELWFNPTGGGGRKWWRTRGYLGERSSGMDGAITDKVVAWMPMPKPSQAS